MNPDRIATLLASGLKPSQVATVVGVTPARISQLLGEESFRLLLSSKEAEVQKTDIEEQAISNKYNAAEHLLINQVMELAPTAEMRDLVGALRVVAERQEKMKTRTTVQVPVSHQHLTVVSVNLPSHALEAPRVAMNSAREVVAIGDRPLAPMSAVSVTDMFKARQAARLGQPAKDAPVGAEVEGGNYEPVSSDPSSEASPAEAVPGSEVSFLEYARR